MQLTASSRSSSYLPQLDGLRALAILSVLAHHYDLAIPKWLDWGPIGVNLFFVLSGYFITRSLWKSVENAQERGQSPWISVGIFHLRRMVRILPAFWIFLLIAFLLGIPEVCEKMQWHLLFLTNFYIAHVGTWPDSVSHLWSLATQEQFYLLWPLVLLFFRGKWFLCAAFACIGIAMIYRFTCFSFHAPVMYRWVMLPGSLDVFAIGGLIAWVTTNRPQWLGSRKLALSFGAFAIACFCLARAFRYGRDVSYEAAWIDVLEAIFLAWLVMGTIRGWNGLAKRLFESPLLVHIGKISFGIYLYHVLVRYVLKPEIDSLGFEPEFGSALRFVLLTTITIFIAGLSWKYVEAPIARWRASFSKRPVVASPFSVPNA